MEFFDRITKRAAEQEQIVCPFCASGYVNEKEHRPLVQCPACEGYAFLAVRAQDEVNEVYLSLSDFTLEEVEVLIRKLGPGYDRSNYRTHWRERQGE
jgi:transcription elongation factor Elf1